VAVFLEAAINSFRQFTVFVAVGAVVIVEADVEGGKVCTVFLADACHQFFRCNTFILRAQHDRGAVGVVCTYVNALVATHFLKAHPDVSLDIFHHVTHVDAAVGIGQGAGDEDFAGWVVH